MFHTKNLDLLTIGFDEIFRQMDAIQGSMTNFPQYNIRKHNDSFIIELALAGYKEKNISVETKDNILTVSHKDSESKTDKKEEYQHKGLASRDFSRQFMLTKDHEVENVTFEDGLLSIFLKNVADKNTKTYQINKTSIDKRTK